MNGRPRDWMAVRANRFATPADDVTEGLRDAIADHHEITRSDIDAVATDARRPVAAVAGTASFYADLASRHQVRVCDGTGCFVARGGAIYDAGTAAQHVYCLGFCYAAPAMLVGDTALTGPDRTLAPRIPYACAAREPVILAGLGGREQPWETWSTVLSRRSGSSIAEEVARSGLRGRGGAEYPVAAKWRAARDCPPPRYVVANGDEGDPGSYCDRLLMEYDPCRVLEGLALCGYAVGARHGLVLVRSEYPAAAAALRKAIEQAKAAGHLGDDIHGSGIQFDIAVHDGAGSYVAGEETALLRSLQGLRGSAQARPPYPTEYGYAGRPTVVQNVETLSAIPWIVRHGGAAYARFGREAETGTKLVCLNEQFTTPGVYEVEFGTPLRRIVEELGGGLRDGQRLRAIQIGGPLGGFLGSHDLDVGLASADLAAYGVSLGHGSVVAIPEQVRAVDLLRHLWTFAARESCGACAPCRVGTRRGLELVGNMDPALAAADETYGRLLDIMKSGSMCAFGSGVAAAVRSLLRVYAEPSSSRS
ncbi:NADH-ubiquinone oxidoreductase-F iron-sulfur binding region domain-containing protein [Nocardia pneumoniae]|uniref:NADH-ubiquinone oxidoreductase-F iron-sulfur binding region domain-containing protein n=1 Tax=Nocardia pneumoniae TaxID=228601 RepID=UPI0002DCDAA7|nr:NADH-ubiquinone oxidoreductase-F iron-sulfur binding region domain-containing protein [Nocardia pneumoniae]